jgi:hypothetical protein
MTNLWECTIILLQLPKLVQRLCFPLLCVKIVLVYHCVRVLTIHSTLMLLSSAAIAACIIGLYATTAVTVVVAAAVVVLPKAVAVTVVAITWY